jgi:hypothetical protein
MASPFPTTPLLCMPLEIQSQIFLMSRNLYLLETCRKIRDRLTSDALFNELVLLAFSRDTSCEDDSAWMFASQICGICVGCVTVDRKNGKIMGMKGANRLKREGDWYRDSYIYGIHAEQDSWDEDEQDDVSGEDGEGEGDRLKTEENDVDEQKNYDDGMREGECRRRGKECLISLDEKRKLQNKIMQSSWFSLRHVLKVEERCGPCVFDFSNAYTEMVEDMGYDPVPDYDFGMVWPKHHHRRHIVHGVGLPRRLL